MIEYLLDSHQTIHSSQTTYSSSCTFDGRSCCALIPDWLCMWWHDSASEDLWDEADEAGLTDGELASPLGSFDTLDI